MSHDTPSQPYRTAAPSRLYQQVLGPVQTWVEGWNRIGRQTRFYAQTVGSIGDLLVNYKIELVRLVAQMGLGTGALILIGGTVAVVGFLMMAAGALIGEAGFNELQGIGIEALLGFVGAFVDIRLAAPSIASVALAATIGAGATAQLGAMRISEEIDALEVIGVRSVAYLASSRVVAGVIVVIPLYCVAVLMAFTATRTIASVYGQSSGVYDHYFHTFLYPLDLVWSLLSVVISATAIMLVHTYYGYTASGGPAGVGEAVGRAVRASLVVTFFVIFFAQLAIYGPHGNFHLSE